jgi:hypothetical protein
MRYKVGTVSLDGPLEWGVRSRVKAIETCATLLNLGFQNVSFADEKSGIREVFTLDHDTGHVEQVYCEHIKKTKKVLTNSVRQLTLQSVRQIGPR